MVEAVFGCTAVAAALFASAAAVAAATPASSPSPAPSAPIPLAPAASVGIALTIEESAGAFVGGGFEFREDGYDRISRLLEVALGPVDAHGVVKFRLNKGAKVTNSYYKLVGELDIGAWNVVREKLPEVVEPGLEGVEIRYAGRGQTNRLQIRHLLGDGVSI